MYVCLIIYPYQTTTHERRYKDMKEYKAYNGYYIGTGANDFKSKEEIDAFHLERAKKTYEQACRLFN